MPTIGLTGGPSTPERYRRALEAVGLTMAPWSAGTSEARAAAEDPEAAMETVDGLLIPGGVDIAPTEYGQTRVHPTVSVEPERDRLELGLARAALAQGVPLLGVCRGIQVINVAAGGTLWQDLPSERPSAVVHMEPALGRDRKRLVHTVDIVPGTELARWIGSAELAVNSIHHQAVRDLPPGLRASATAPDGVVEALEATRGPWVLAVQWHPEDLWNASPRHAALFAAFAQAARARAAARSRHP